MTLPYQPNHPIYERLIPFLSGKNAVSIDELRSEIKPRLLSEERHLINWFRENGWSSVSYKRVSGSYRAAYIRPGCEVRISAEPVAINPVRSSANLAASE